MRDKQPRIQSEKYSTDKWFGSDETFNRLYPPIIQILATRHWTPLRITRSVTDFLAVKNDTRILDIGSGVGKFCLAAAHFRPNSFFYGIEQRKTLVRYARAARDKLGLKNALFLHGNFTQVDFTLYDHFYFYNSFYENLSGTEKIDDSIAYSTELFDYYTLYLKNQLELKPRGTRLVTFHSLEEEVPESYQEVSSEMGGLLKFWKKK